MKSVLVCIALASQAPGSPFFKPGDVWVYDFEYRTTGLSNLGISHTGIRRVIINNIQDSSGSFLVDYSGVDSGLYVRLDQSTWDTAVKKDSVAAFSRHIRWREGWLLGPSGQPRTFYDLFAENFSPAQRFRVEYGGDTLTLARWNSQYAFLEGWGTLLFDEVQGAQMNSWRTRLELLSYNGNPFDSSRLRVLDSLPTPIRARRHPVRRIRKSEGPYWIPDLEGFEPRGRRLYPKTKSDPLFR